MKNLFFFLLGGFFTIIFFSMYKGNEEPQDEMGPEHTTVQPTINEDVIVDKVITKLLDMGIILKKGTKSSTSKPVKKTEKKLVANPPSTNTTPTKIVEVQTQVPVSNVLYFELSTHKGLVKLYLSMPKDELKSLFGIPETTDMFTSGKTIYETWKYLGRNNYIPEFTFKFVNGKLKSYDQYREP